MYILQLNSSCKCVHYIAQDFTSSQIKVLLTLHIMLHFPGHSFEACFPASFLQAVNFKHHLSYRTMAAVYIAAAMNPGACASKTK